MIIICYGFGSVFVLCLIAAFILTFVKDKPMTEFIPKVGDDCNSNINNRSTAMNEPIRLWVEALRSGKYKQGKRQLENSDGSLCCLGVLCKIAPVALKLTGGGTIEGASLACQPAVKQWSGLKTFYGDVGIDSLASMNDADGYTFNQIADYIEENWKLLVEEDKHE